jgi:hypothetical protein
MYVRKEGKNKVNAIVVKYSNSVLFCCSKDLVTNSIPNNYYYN